MWDLHSLYHGRDQNTIHSELKGEAECLQKQVKPIRKSEIGCFDPFCCAPSLYCASSGAGHRGFGKILFLYGW